MRSGIIALFLLASAAQVIAQSDSTQSEKHSFYWSWGWNRAVYTNSDIKLNGADHNFVVRKAKAIDRPVPFELNKYFNPIHATKPQYNVVFGFHWKKDLWLSMGFDHMKYVVDQDQVAVIDGEINAGSKYDGIYEEVPFVIADDFLTFEHTNGLNYWNIEIKYEPTFIKKEKVQFNGFFGGGPALIITKTDVNLLHFERRDVFHVTGFGIGATGGFKLLFWNRIFIRPELKTGWIDIVGVRTTNRDRQDWAKHNFMFLQGFFTLGYQWEM